MRSSLPDVNNFFDFESFTQARRTRRLERYQEVMDRHHRGESDRAIARQMGLHRATVAKYVQAGVFPERVTRSYDSRARPFTDVIERRWSEGCHNAAQIARELKAMGFEGSYYVIRRWVTSWRSHRPGRLPPTHDRKVLRPSSHRVAGWLLADEQNLSPEGRAFLETLWQRCPRLKTSAQLAREFANMVHDRKPEELPSWIVRPTNADVPHELKGFAKGLQADYAAVEAGLTLPWNKGPVEGHVNRLQWLKRQMYGRAPRPGAFHE
jgi:transposase